MTAEGAVMQAETLLRDITEYCRRTGVAEATFGRLGVNDGKFVNRLRDGGKITTTTYERVRSFMAVRGSDGRAVEPAPHLRLGGGGPAAGAGAARSPAP